MIDEELLRPSREHLAALGNKLKTMQAETHNKIQRFAANDKDYARQMWREYHLAAEPLTREREAVLKVIADYYALQADLPPVVVPASHLRCP